MNGRALLAVGAGALIVAGCGMFGGSGRQARAEAQQPWVTDRAVGGSEMEERIARNASGAQAGQVTEVTGDQLVIEPYERAGHARMSLAEQTPVFRGDERISMDPQAALQPGTDVNVYFDEPQAGQPPRVLGISILAEERAREMRDAIGARGLGRDQPAAMHEFQQLTQDAAWQAGRVGSLSENQLVIEPYQPGVGEARLEMSPEIPVFRAGERVGHETLQQGEDVRVFFEPVEGAAPRLIAVELLPETEVRRLRGEFGRDDG
jgi:hypothetical protein